jgi:hypothetical protein
MFYSTINGILKKRLPAGNVTGLLRPWTGLKERSLRWGSVFNAIGKNKRTWTAGWHVTSKWHWE